MAKYIYIIVLAFVTATTQAQENGEDSLSLNNYWFFKTDPGDIGEKDHWYRPAANNAGWEGMKVPSNWDTHNEYAHYAGKAWYRKKLTVPAEWKGKLVRLLFEAVYHDSKVWLNGHLLGTSHSGFLPFEFDVSAWLQYGSENTIVVCADNSFRRGALWNWGGIRRPVFLVAGHQVRIVDQYIAPAIDLQKRSADVSFKVQLQNAGKADEEIQGEIVLSAPNGFRRSLPFTKKMTAGSKEEIVLTTSLTKKEVHLWSCDDPFLYNSEVRIKSKTGQLHASKDRFGLRKIEVDNATYTFKLNGEPIRPMGFNLVPDDRTTGNTLPLWRIKEDIDLLKSLGANLSRLSHVPLPKEALDYLDEKGMMIFDEVPLWGFDVLADKHQQLPKDWLQQLMARDHNHACVIGWSVGNEIGQYPAAMEYVEDAINYLHKTDSQHLAVMVSHTAQRGRDPLDFSDIGLINRYGSTLGSQVDKIHELHRDKVLFCAEYGYGQLSEDLNADVNAKAMVDSLRYKPYLIGGSLWTFNDYRSGFIGTKEISENRPWGIVDVFRQKKKAYYSFRKEYSPVRDIKVACGETGSLSTATITIIPRMVLDLPAFRLNNYVLVWKATDTAQKILDGGFITLPLIKPGDAALSYPVQWKQHSDMAALKIELVSPLQYAVYDTLINLQQPPMPVITYAQGVRTDFNNLHPNTAAIRVVFQKHPLVKGYKVRYGKDGLSEETSLTVNHFIEIPKLAINEIYQFQLVAVNDKGETATPVQKIKTDVELAPPVIYYTEPADSGFFAGYASQADDYLFKVQYTTTQGDYTNARTMQSRTKGVLFVPDLENGQTYYYRLQRVKQNMYESAWSEEIAVTPDGRQRPRAPVLKGLLQQNGHAMLFFEPVKKATGYLVQYRSGSANWKEMYINQAMIQQVLIKNSAKAGVLECRVAAFTESGLSDFTEPISNRQ